jgi:hypothetical protein
MAEETERSALERIALVLSAHGVEFIVVGGQAELLIGSPRVTYDVDLCYRRSKENLRRLAAALREIKPTLRNAPPDLPFIIDEQSLALRSNFTFETTLGPLDFLGYLEPVGDFDAIADRAFDVDIGECRVRVIHIDDLIAIKQHSKRSKIRMPLIWGLCELQADRGVRRRKPMSMRGLTQNFNRRLKEVFISAAIGGSRSRWAFRNRTTRPSFPNSIFRALTQCRRVPFEIRRYEDGT